MGNCFGNSDEEKTTAPRTRIPTKTTETTKPIENKTPVTSVNSPSTSVTIGKNNEEDFKFGASPTDEHVRQQELLRNIVTKTTKNFIHVTATQAPLEKNTVAKRHSYYTSKLKGISIKASDGKLALTPPVPSAANVQNLKQLLSKPAPLDENIRKFAISVNGSLKDGMKVRDVG